MSEFLTKSNIGYLTDIIRQMCAGGHPEREIAEFVERCDSLTADEVDEAFNQLSLERLPFEDNAQVIAFYHDVIEDKLAARALDRFAPGHPVRIYLEENRLQRRLFRQLGTIDPRQDKAKFAEVFDRLCTVELHWVRKENQLFPMLEKHGWDSPSKNMWAFHDDIRAELKAIRQALQADDLELVVQLLPNALSEMQRLINVEEGRLLPNALNMLSEQEWADMRTGDEEIGWMLDKTPPLYPPVAETPAEPAAVEPAAEAPAPRRSKPTPKKAKDLPFSTEGADYFDEGYLTPEQVNMIFKFLPVDITYVNEDDRVVFYNRGEERVFPRSANVIGREVKLCHPPKSVDSVLRILDEFRKGTKDHADFWINKRGRFIHIRYFAVRDAQQNYRGVIEMSQDVTEIRGLEGEKRLLDWD